MDGRLYLAQSMEMLIKWHSPRSAVSGIASMTPDVLRCIGLYEEGDQFPLYFHFSAMCFRITLYLLYAQGLKKVKRKIQNAPFMLIIVLVSDCKNV